MNYSLEVQHMCPLAKGPNHGPAPIPEEGKWIQAKEAAPRGRTLAGRRLQKYGNLQKKSFTLLIFGGFYCIISNWKVPDGNIK